MTKNTLGKFLKRHVREILAALAKSDDPVHRGLAQELAPAIGADLDRLHRLPPIPPRPSFGRR